MTLAQVTVLLAADRKANDPDGKASSDTEGTVEDLMMFANMPLVA